MPSILSHPAVPLALFPAVRRYPDASRLLMMGVIASILPDADTIGFFLGIPYRELLGHRGLTHSLLFAVMIAGVCAFRFLPQSLPAPLQRWAVAYLFVSAVSHGILDACTTGGMGIAFLSPLSNHRYFLPWRPILVSPIGMSAFFTARGAAVLASELQWVWLPAGAVAVASLLAESTVTGAWRFQVEKVRLGEQTDLPARVPEQD